jgi:hypothetical protein
MLAYSEHCINHLHTSTSSSREPLNKSQIVIPAHARIQSNQKQWIPAFARMTLIQRFPSTDPVAFDAARSASSRSCALLSTNDDYCSMMLSRSFARREAGTWASASMRQNTPLVERQLATRGFWGEPPIAPHTTLDPVWAAAVNSRTPKATAALTEPRRPSILLAISRHSMIPDIRRPVVIVRVQACEHRSPGQRIVRGEHDADCRRANSLVG